MRVLAFDTATRATAVALSDPETVPERRDATVPERRDATVPERRDATVPERRDGTVLERRDDPPLERRDDPPPGARPRHATRLLPLIAQTMDAAGLSWEAIDRIAVGLGPGTFTGLRIGVATARALAQASGIPVVGVSTLHSLALNGRLISGPEADVVVAVLDARRGEVYAAAWEAPRLQDPGAVPLLAPTAMAPEGLAERILAMGSAASAARTVAIGEGAIAFRDVLERAGMCVPEDRSPRHLVTAAGHCLIARHLAVTEPGELTPDYQRLPDAQPRSTIPAGAEPPREP